jgi:uridine kinase
VHEDAVRKRHAAEAQLLHEREGTVIRVDVRPVLDLIAAARPRRGVVLVGIGGHGGAGKTTLAHSIPEAQVVSTDEFWDGQGFDLERLRREVIEPLAAGRAACFASWDWQAQRARDEERVVTPEGVVVIEGVCALHRSMRHAYAVRVWVEAPYAIRLARGVARDGEEARRTWTEVWMPSEDRYVEQDDPLPSAHVIVDGGDGTVA